MNTENLDNIFTKRREFDEVIELVTTAKNLYPTTNVPLLLEYIRDAIENLQQLEKEIKKAG